MMPAISFSGFVPELLSGAKQQTTRKPRTRSLKVGDTLKCYYNQRAKKTCNNCINIDCMACVDALKWTPFGEMCDDDSLCHHTNFFGDAEITEIIKFGNFTTVGLKKWAVADGFDSFKWADEWFTKRYGFGWMIKDWEIIKFSPNWIVKRQASEED